MHFYHSKNLPGWPEIAATFDHTRFHDNDNRIHVRPRNRSSHKHLDNESGFDRSGDGMAPGGLLTFFAYRGKIEGQNHKKHLPPQNALDQQADNKAIARLLYLFDFDQGSAEILRVQKQYRLAVGPDTGLPISQDARPFALQLVACRDDVCHFETDMMHAAIR